MIGYGGIILVFNIQSQTQEYLQEKGAAEKPQSTLHSQEKRLEESTKEGETNGQGIITEMQKNTEQQGEE